MCRKTNCSLTFSFDIYVKNKKIFIKNIIKIIFNIITALIKNFIQFALNQQHCMKWAKKQIAFKIYLLPYKLNMLMLLLHMCWTTEL